MNRAMKPAAPAIAKGRYQRIRKRLTTTVMTRATRYKTSFPRRSWMNISIGTRTASSAKIPPKAKAPQISRRRMSAPMIPAKSAAHSKNPSINPICGLISCLWSAGKLVRRENRLSSVRGRDGYTVASSQGKPNPRLPTGTRWLRLQFRVQVTPWGACPVLRKGRPSWRCTSPTSVLQRSQFARSHWLGRSSRPHIIHLPGCARFGDDLTNLILGQVKTAVEIEMFQVAELRAPAASSPPMERLHLRMGEPDMSIY